MTDGQVIAAVIGALVSISTAGWAALRWAVTQITKAINDSTSGQKEAAAAMAAAQMKAADAQREAASIAADAMLEQAKAFATMSAKHAQIFDWIEAHTPVEMQRVPLPLPDLDPPSIESERRTPTRERNPYGIPQHLPEAHKGQPYHYTRPSKNRKT